MRVAIFNVKFSPNLGDGVIAECLEHYIAQHRGWQVASIDIAGRTAYEPSRSGRTRALALTVLRSLPQQWRDVTVEFALRRKLSNDLGPRWRQEVARCDFAVIGGGQLIQAFDLNFPLKLAQVIAACESHGVPVGLFAVGATTPQSLKGERLLRELCASRMLVHAAARDDSSAQTLATLGRAASIVRDPGLLAATTWPHRRDPSRKQRVIGVGIAHPTLLAYHSSHTETATQSETLDAYAQLIDALVKAGHQVVAFTNGAAEDEIALTEVRKRLADHTKVGARFAARARTPEQLCRSIAELDGLIAHRLHSHIVAYSYGIPSIGLAWDCKIDAFFASIDRRSYLIYLLEHSAVAVTDLMRRALEESIDASHHAAVIGEAAAGIDAMIAIIETTCERYGDRPQYQPAIGTFASARAAP